MSDAEPDAEPVDTTDTEDAEILLADPDDYHETQRLREIHEARREVLEQARNMDINEKSGSGIYVYSLTELSHTVAMYVNEVLPLMRQSGTDPPELPDACEHDTVFDFAASMGMDSDGSPAPPTHSLAAFRACNEFLADVKPLITEDDTDEWEV